MDPGRFLILGYDTENLETLKAFRPFGVFLTSRFRDLSPSEQRAHIQKIRKALPDVWLVTDQEGGYASWLLPGYPSPQELGRMPPSRARAYVERMVRALASRVDGNFAPVVDRFRKGDPVISDKGRAFGEDPLRVMLYAWMTITLHRRVGLVPVAKHFLAQSLAVGDPHTGESVVKAGWDELEADLEIYRFLIRERLPAVMAGHMRIPAGDDRPVLRSPFWIGRVLREDLGFSGMVITDDLSMGAVEDLASTVEGAFLAGVDLFLVAWDREGAFGRIRQTLQDILRTSTGRKEAEEKIRRIQRLRKPG